MPEAPKERPVRLGDIVRTAVGLIPGLMKLAGWAIILISMFWLPWSNIDDARLVAKLTGAAGLLLLTIVRLVEWRPE